MDYYARRSGGLVHFQHQLVIVSAFSLIGTFIGAKYFRPTDSVQLTAFYQKVKPFGFWNTPRVKGKKVTKKLRYKMIQYILLVCIIIDTLFIGQSLINDRLLRTTTFGIFLILLFFVFKSIHKKLTEEEMQ